ncbi:MAG: hypothetical protein V1773_18005 [bacterium]
MKKNKYNLVDRTNNEQTEVMCKFGELIHLGGYFNNWFKGLRNPCYLMFAIDNDTNNLFLRLMESGNKSSAKQMMLEYISIFGLPRRVYIDYRTVFYSENHLKELTGILKKTGCKMVFTRSVKVKERIEENYRRVFSILPDLLEQKSVFSIEEANIFLSEQFIGEYNKKYSILDNTLNSYHLIFKNTIINKVNNNEENLTEELNNIAGRKPSQFCRIIPLKVIENLTLLVNAKDADSVKSIRTEIYHPWMQRNKLLFK